MSGRRGAFRRRAATTERNDFAPEDSPKDKTDERIPIVHEGGCEVGFCGLEAACLAYSNNTYICLCPHDSTPPTLDGKCPRTRTVPINPKRIDNISLPKNSLNETNRTAESKLNYSTEASTNKATVPYEIVGIAAAAAIFLACIYLVIRKLCYKTPKNSLSPSPVALKRNILVAERYAPNPQYSSCPASSVPLLQRENLTFLNSIGEGFFGKVFKGELRIDSPDQTQIVAIKVMKESASREAEEDFLREVDIMSTFKHPNILSLLGVVPREANIGPMMVFEYMPHGDLAEVLRSQKTFASKDMDIPMLAKTDLLSISLQIASGMKYLAAQRFVHRDLACRNCLLTSGPIVKISDFGMSRDVYTCDYYRVGTKHILPVRWMSPECVMYGRFTLESDIWSYGVVLWEIYSFGKQPYYGHTNDQVLKLIYDGIILSPPEDCPPLVCELMKNCWKTEPRDRIKFTEICEKLERAQEDFEGLMGAQITVECEFKGAFTMKRLPRPPPKLPAIDLLDPEGYLLPNEVKEPVQYLVTLSG